MDREISKKERQRAALRKRRPYIIGGLVVVGIVVFASGMMRKSIKERDLTISQVEIGNIQITFSASGKIVPAFEEVINSPIRSRIMEADCKAGDSVGAGTPLLRLDLESAETKLTQLQDEIAMKQYEHQQQTINAETQLTNLEMRIDVKEMEVSRLEAELKNERYLDSLGSGTGDRVRAELAYKTGMLELARNFIFPGQTRNRAECAAVNIPVILSQILHIRLNFNMIGIPWRLLYPTSTQERIARYDY